MLLARAGAWLDRAAFKPATLPNDLITAIALVPPVAAGLIIFKLPALEMLAVALVAGIAAYLAARWIWRGHGEHAPTSPILAPVFGVALIGAGAGLLVTAEVAALAVVLELLRARYVPLIRAQAGLLALAAIALITRGATFVYLNPNGRCLVVLAAFLLGAVVAVYNFHWDFSFQLDSGPTWFVAGLLLADRRLLPEAWVIRPVLGIAAGLFAVGLRKNGYGIEAAYFTVACVQAVMALVVVMLWGYATATDRWKRTRRLRQREANLRVVKPISRA